MKKSLLQIIKEEISNFYSNSYIANEPSIADKYYEKNLGIMASTNYQQKNQIDGEFVGYVTKQWKNPITPIPVYKNPKNLNDFTKEARGILLKNGDLFLAQSFNALHDNLLELLANKGVVPLASIYDYDKNYPEEFVAVQRTFTTNNFIQSMAYDEFPPHYQIIFDTGNKRQPYTFKALHFSKY